MRGKIGYQPCEDHFSIRLQELVKINQLENNLPDLFQNKIGTLYDEFNVNIPHRFGKEYDWLWSEETVSTIKQASYNAAEILNEVRLKPKPYEPLSSEDVRKHLRVIEKEMIEDMANQFLSCACPHVHEIGEI